MLTQLCHLLFFLTVPLTSLSSEPHNHFPLGKSKSILIRCGWVHAKSFQSCLTLCDGMGSSLQGTSVHGILQARILEWFAISSSRVSSLPWDQIQISYIADGFFTIWATREDSHFNQILIINLQSVSAGMHRDGNVHTSHAEYVGLQLLWWATDPCLGSLP